MGIISTCPTILQAATRGRVDVAPASTSLISRGQGADTTKRDKLAAPSSSSSSSPPTSSPRWDPFCGIFRLDFWYKSVRTVAVLIRNVLLSIACSAVAIGCCSLGNVLSGRPTPQQSYREFVAAVLMWTMAFFCIVILLVQISLLMNKTFQARPGRRAGLRFAAARVVRATWGHVCVAVIVVCGFVWGYDVVTDGRFRAVRVEYYASCFIAHIFMSIVWIRTRRIFQEETVQGQELVAKRQLERRPSTTRVIVSPNARFASYRLKFGRYLKAYALGSPAVFSIALAGTYVQVTNALHIKTQTELIVFTCGSIFVKLLAQEAIKLAMLRRTVKDTRTMFLCVGLPTVLIDTQVRVMLQLFRGASLNLAGSVAFAVVEVMFRWIKVLLLSWQMTRAEHVQFRRRLRLRPPATALFSATTAKLPRPHIKPRKKRTSSLWRSSRLFSLSSPVRAITSPRDATDWKHQMMVFHAAEAYADMSAEYIAIGCSALILYLYGHHPKYDLIQRAIDDAGDPSLPPSQFANHTSSVVTQIVLELVVDVFSCVLELAQGVEFAELRKYGSYVAITFVGIGVMNVQVSASMYLKIP